LREEEYFTREPDFNLPLGPPNAYGWLDVRHVRMRPCNTEYHVEPAQPGTPLASCGCGLFAIGHCTDCGAAVCGKHAVQGDKVVCVRCFEVARPAREADEQARKRADYIGGLSALLSSVPFRYEKFASFLFNQAEKHCFEFTDDEHVRIHSLVSVAVTKQTDQRQDFRKLVMKRRQHVASHQATVEFARKAVFEMEERLRVLEAGEPDPPVPVPPSGLRRWSSAARKEYAGAVGKRQLFIANRPGRLRDARTALASAQENLIKQEEYLDWEVRASRFLDKIYKAGL
jgi:hypothetical protein